MKKMVKGLFKNRTVFLVSINQMIRVFARSQLWIFLPLYLYERRDVPYYMIGIILTIMALVSIPFTLIAGPWIDKTGPKKISIITEFILFIDFSVLTYFVFSSFKIYGLFLALIISEPLMNIIGSTDNVLVSNSTRVSERNDSFSTVRIFQNIGFSVGPAVGGFIASISYFYIFLITTTFVLAEIFIYTLVKPDDIKNSENKERISLSTIILPLRNKIFLLTSIGISLFYIFIGQWGTPLTFFWKNFDHINDISIGYLYTENGIVVTLLQIPVNYILKKTTDVKRINLGFLIYMLSYSGLIFFTGFRFLIIDTFFITIGENVISPSINTLVSRISDNSNRGKYFASFQSIFGFISPFSMVVGTLLLSYFSNRLNLMWVPLIIFGSIIIILFLPLWNKVKYNDQDI